MLSVIITGGASGIGRAVAELVIERGGCVGVLDLDPEKIEDLLKRFPDRIVLAEIPDEVVLNGDPLLLQILINNLLENAQKYAPRETPIKLNLTENGGSIRLEVIDEGPGIPPAERKRIFNRFYRIENETTRKTQGTGLGLYLCKKIAQAHRADISVTDHAPQGSNFAVEFLA